MMAKPGVMFYFDIRPCIKRLDAMEKGRLFEAILDYGEFGIVPELDGALGVAWDFIQPKLDRDSGRYDRQVEQRQYAVYVREAKKKEETPMPFDVWKHEFSNEGNRAVSADIGRYPTTTSNPNLQPTTPTCNLQPTTDNNKGADKPPNRHRFTPPTVDEVKAYCIEKSYSVDPQRFVDYYTSNGWKVGKNSMKDWKAAVRTWNGKEQPNGKVESKPAWTVGTVV
jgi:hypothetical protein